jgi:hypothetical protein
MANVAARSGAWPMAFCSTMISRMDHSVDDPCGGAPIATPGALLPSGSPGYKQGARRGSYSPYVTEEQAAS